MVNADRQMIMETNRSLRNIKNELETLLEKGVIDESVFDTINSSLPEESPLSGPLRTTANRAGAATPASNNNNGPASVTKAMESLNVTASRSPAPPSYEDTPPPGPPPRAQDTKPVIAHARALYRYAGADARDVHLERDDKIAVHEYMNQDWWMGRNLRTGQEGIFPRNYVFVEQETKAPAPAPAPYQQPQYRYPTPYQGPPQQQNPYNAHAPPMAVAEGSQHGQEQQQQGDGKVGEYGKKFGKKLGNAAIFGAGATIGSNIVNSIF